MSILFITIDLNVRISTHLLGFQQIYYDITIL